MAVQRLAVCNIQNWILSCKGLDTQLFPNYSRFVNGLRPLHVSSACQRNLKAIRRDQHRRQTVAKFEKDRLHLRAVLRNKILPEVVQRKASADLAGHPRDASITRVRNRCVLTGRGRGVVKEFGLNRMKFRKLADFGMLAGVTRSSW